MRIKASCLKSLPLFSILAALVWLTTVACAPLPEVKIVITGPPPAASTATPAPTGEAAIAATPSPTGPDRWFELRQKPPYPFTTPLPPATPTTLDSVYAKVEPGEGTPIPCRRCPDYLTEGGPWKLSLDKGAFWIFHPPTGWGSMGSFTVSGNRLTLFNDPACWDTVGLYEWTLEGGRLDLEVIEDACQVDRRARNFSILPWQSCQPPSMEAAITDHWPRPPGCGIEN